MHRLAVGETDPKLLIQLIHELESLSVKRGEQLALNPSPEDTRAIQSALAQILTINIKRPGLPDPRSGNGHVLPGKQL